MTTVTFTRLMAPTVLTTSAATLFTVTGVTNTTFRLGRLRFTNTDTVVHTFTAYAIESGGSASASNCFANAISVGPNSYVDIDIPELVNAGFVQAKADAATSITVFQLDGLAFSP